MGADGYVDSSVQDSFCSGGGCTISVIYDQSPNKTNLVKSPKALWLPNGGDEANATLGKITINGHTAYGIYVDNSGGSTGVGYRNNATKGLAKNDNAGSHVHRWRTESATTSGQLLRLRQCRNQWHRQWQRHHGGPLLGDFHPVGPREAGNGP